MGYDSLGGKLENGSTRWSLIGAAVVVKHGIDKTVVEEIKKSVTAFPRGGLNRTL